MKIQLAAKSALGKMFILKAVSQGKSKIQLEPYPCPTTVLFITKNIWH